MRFGFYLKLVYNMILSYVLMSIFVPTHARLHAMQNSFYTAQCSNPQYEALQRLNTKFSNLSVRPLKYSKNRTLYAMTVSIFFPLTLTHSMPAAPTKEMQHIATAT